MSQSSNNREGLLIETATVLESDEQGVVLECVSRSACSSCGKADECGTSAIAKAFPSRRHHLHVSNEELNAMGLDPVAGDQLEIGLPGRQLVRSALLVYLLPLLSLLLFSGLAQMWVEQNQWPEWLTVPFAFAGLVLGLVLCRYLTRRQSVTRVSPRVLGSVATGNKDSQPE